MDKLLYTPSPEDRARLGFAALRLAFENAHLAGEEPPPLPSAVRHITALFTVTDEDGNPVREDNGAVFNGIAARVMAVRNGSRRA